MKHVVLLFKTLLLVGLLAYLVYAFTCINVRGGRERCNVLNVQIIDSLHASFITAADVDRKLRRAHLHPEGQLMDSVSGQDIENSLLRDPFIQKATCYKTPGGMVNILVEQRIPVLRVRADNGDDYYLDENGYRMKPTGYQADLVVVTGHVDEQYARKSLLPVGQYIRSDAFWDSQIEQINVTPQRELQLFMRIGDQTIHAGTPADFPQKLANLRLFYEKVMPEVGWNRYKDINISFANQIICKH